MRLLITGARAPVALHLARLMCAADHEVILADSFAWPLARATRFKKAYLRLPSPLAGLEAYGDAVERIAQRHKIDMIIPTCEEVFFLAAARERRHRHLPLLAPDFERLKRMHDKFAFSQLARGFGADPPHTYRLETPEAVLPFAADTRNLVFKPVWSRFGDRALIRPDSQTLLRLKPSPTDPWVAQTYLPGEELCVYAVAFEGRLAALQAYRPLWRAGRGAGLAFAQVEDAAINRFVKEILAAQAWHGQIAFDLRRDAEGALHVI
jgi:glutathione synthase/RimK-type ligase-like ATP-grasp enzyme